MKYSTLIFPGSIEVSEERPLAAILADWIDSEGNLVLTPESRIAPTRVSPSTKLVFERRGGSSEITFLGSTVMETQFMHMADFAYFPKDPAGHLRGPHKQITPQPFSFEPSSSSTVRGTEEAGSAVAVLRFKDGAEKVPSAPTSKASSVDADPELVERMKNLFAFRPVWQRASLEEAVGGEIRDWKFSAALRQCSYLFLDGPWRKCYVRFGFDPRTDPEAKKLQMIDFRDPQFQPSNLVDIHFRSPPSQRSQLYQLCDVEDVGVQALLGEVTRQLQPDPHTGWLTEAELDSIRNQMKIRADTMRRKR